MISAGSVPKYVIAEMICKQSIMYLLCDNRSENLMSIAKAGLEIPGNNNL